MLIAIQMILILQPKSGAEAIQEVLSFMDLSVEVARLKRLCKHIIGGRYVTKLMRRIKVISGMLQGNHAS